MTQSFALDQKRNWGELSKLESPGFYWINTDRKSDAEQLCKQVVKALSPDARAAIICVRDNPKQFLSDISDVLVPKIPLFSLPDKKDAFFQLTSDFKNALTTNQRLFLFITHSDVWQYFTTKELHEWVHLTRNWLNNEQSSFLVLNYDVGANTIQQQLISQHRVLDGLTHFQWLEDSWRYIIEWWATHNGLTANKILNIKNINTEWLINADETNPRQMTLFFDESLYYIEKNILEGGTPNSESWHLIENNQSLTECSKQLKAATVIYALYHVNQVEELVKQVHTLRKHCGNYLKIVVREMSKNLRFSDQRLLMAAGANLIVPQPVSISKFLIMIDGLQGQYFLRHTPEHIDQWLESMQPLKTKGYLPPKEFAQAVKTRIEDMFLPENGKGLLIALHPMANISAAQTLSVCNLHRMGDIITVIENQLFLFLSDCTLNDLDITFTYIFRMPITDIFSNYDVWNQDLMIISTLKKMNLDTKIVLPETNTPFMKKKKEQEPQAPVLRRQPKELDLMTAHDKEQSL